MADTTRPSPTARQDTGVADAGATDRGPAGPGEGPEEATSPEPSSSAEPDRPTDLPKGQLVATTKRALRGFKRDNLSDLAAGLTYYGVLSVLPGLIVLFSVLGLLGPSAAGEVVSQAERLAPGSAANVIKTLVEQAQGSRSGAGVAAVLGIVVAVWSASGYVAAFMRASNTIYGIPEGRPIWKTVPIRVGVTILAVVVLTVAAAIVVLSGPVAHAVGDVVGLGDTAVMVWNIVKWPVLVVIVAALLAVLYWAAPNARQGGIRWLSPGGLVGVLGWIGVSALFAVYVVVAASYDKTYGSLAGVIIFLVWLWLTNLAILFGAEVNAELDRGRAIEGGMPDRVEPFAEPRDTRAMDDRDREAVEQALRERS
ncbi:YihY/virulence factor BrkB family protein [Monashia sp. NPDC004114]